MFATRLRTVSAWGNAVRGGLLATGWWYTRDTVTIKRKYVPIAISIGNVAPQSA